MKFKKNTVTMMSLLAMSMVVADDQSFNPSSWIQQQKTSIISDNEKKLTDAGQQRLSNLKSGAQNDANNLLSSSDDDKVEQTHYQSLAEFNSRLMLGVQSGNYTTGALDFMYPILNSSNSLFYVNALGNYNSLNPYQASLGFGYRSIAGYDHFIWGLYGFYDFLQSKNKHNYNQATGGVEFMSENIDFHMNAYFPFGPTEHFVRDISEPALPIGHSLEGLDTDLFEDAEKGMDTEIGTTVWRNAYHPLRAYIGYYHYGFGGQGASINGASSRLEQVINTYFRINANYRYDAENKNQWVVGLQLFLGGVKQTTVNLNSFEQLRGRMMDPVQRYGLFTSEHSVSTYVTAPFDVYYVKATAVAGGDGTYEHPYQSVAQALQQATNPGDVVYIYSVGNNTYTINGGLTPATGVTVQGSGVALTYNGITFLPAIAAPTLSFNTASGASGFTLVDNTQLMGINIVGTTTTGNAILVQGNNVTIQNVSIGPAVAGQQAFNFGINIDGQSSNTTINNFAIQSIYNSAIYSGGASNINLTNGSVTNSNVGVTFIQVNGLTMNNIQANNNSGNGVTLYGVQNATLTNITANGNTGFGSNGINITGASSDISLNNITVDDNSGPGINIMGGTNIELNLGSIHASGNYNGGCQVVQNGNCLID